MCAQTVRTLHRIGKHVTLTNPNRRTRLIAGSTAGALAVAGAVLTASPAAAAPSCDTGPPVTPSRN